MAVSSTSDGTRERLRAGAALTQRQPRATERVKGLHEEGAAERAKRLDEEAAAAESARSAALLVGARATRTRNAVRLDAIDERMTADAEETRGGALVAARLLERVEDRGALDLVE